MQVSDSVIIGRTGTVVGSIAAKDAVIGGSMNGNINASDKIQLQTGARLAGDIICRGLIVEDGVYFEGNCRMPEQKGATPKSAAAGETDARKQA
jgi:cytoskeletal protein CcmA (bactofilin family)